MADFRNGARMLGGCYLIKDGPSPTIVQNWALLGRADLSLKGSTKKIDKLSWIDQLYAHLSHSVQFSFKILLPTIWNGYQVLAIYRKVGFYWLSLFALLMSGEVLSFRPLVCWACLDMGLPRDLNSWPEPAQTFGCSVNIYYFCVRCLWIWPLKPGPPWVWDRFEHFF